MQPAEAEAPATPDKDDLGPKPFDLRGAKRLTGDWGGLRTDLEDRGVRLKIKLMNQMMVNVRGGKETKNGHDTAGSYELDLYLDLEEMGLIPGATFWIRGKGTWGGDDSDFDTEKIGGLFKTNQDASSEEPIFVDKWHWQQFLADERIEIRFGRQEPVKDLFDTSKVIGHEDKYFLNRALVRNATVPSSKGLSLFAKAWPTETLYLSAGVFDAHSRDRQTNFNTAFHDEDEFRFYGEIGWDQKSETTNGKLWGHYRAGVWYDPSEHKKFFDTLGGARVERFDVGGWGYYFGFDQMVWKENDDLDDGQGLAVAARYGHACAEAVQKVEHFWSAAAQYTGLLPGREKDVLGLGVAQGILSDDYRIVEPDADRETVYELYYAIHVAPWLIVSPDFQYITNAGGDKSDPHAMVAGLRFKMSL
jgi:porin